MTTQILLLLALHVVISCMMSRLKWSKLQQCLSLHRLLDTFPCKTAIEIYRVGHHGGVRLETHNWTRNNNNIIMFSKETILSAECKYQSHRHSHV